VTARTILKQDTADPSAGGTHDRLLAWAEDLGIKDELEQDGGLAAAAQLAFQSAFPIDLG
jgi:hypothetical protein